ncbi:MAG: histidine phosphatase family protein [Cellulomonadaceae bacterium]|jgi:phosphohistidine phosphatase|nr:histidine phosphatase family protein [Cellulomonadaceae bacterium]
MTEHRLILLRHAKAEPLGGIEDAQRPLALKGRDQAVRVGQSLASAGILPEAALVSSAVRTRETWRLVAAQLPIQPALVTVSDDLYEAAVSTVFQAVRGLNEDVHTAIVVGHEPTMAWTAQRLATQDSDRAALAQVSVGVPTAAWSVLTSDLPWAQWQARTARLESVNRP